ncbi:hypothetical protein FRB96_005560 [Tulasnella sp. 330]|nr:hypothetical protein FRB96_005560 [Tulasnella sp. 330]
MDSRLYISMIQQTSARFPNWCPATPVKPGDFGEINSQSGEFEREGNIYELKEVTDAIPSLLGDDFRPKYGRVDDELVICSEHTISGDVELGGTAAATGMAHASLKAHFKIVKGQRGAFLVMVRPRAMSLPSDLPWRELAKIKRLTSMLLVTEVTVNEQDISVELIGDLPIAAPVGSAGGNTAVTWKASRRTHLFRTACSPSGAADYSTLLKLKKMSPRWKEWCHKLIKWRDSPPPEVTNDDEIWEDASVPWATLDDTGKEDDFEDTIFD